MHKRRSKQAAAIFVLVVFTLVLPQVAFAAPPSVSVTIESPADGSTVTLAASETTADVPVSGKASVSPGDEAGKNTTLVYTMDRSSSMTTDAGVDCDGNGDTDSRINCEKRAVGFANAKADDADSVIALAGVAAFGSTGEVQDVDRTAAGTQKLVAPEFDSADAGMTPDVVDAANAVGIVPGTNYSGGLISTFEIINDAANDQPHNLVIFMSDGRNNSGATVTTVPVPANTLIKTFALGEEVDCNSRSIASGERGSLQDVADMSTEGPGSGSTSGVCKVVTDMSTLGNEIATAIAATLDSLTWTLDGGAQTAIPNSGIDPDLPQTAPATVSWNFTANDLAARATPYKICVQAHGSSGATPLEAEDCVNVTIKAGNGPIDPCTAAFGDPGLLTDDTLAQTLWDGGLDALSPLTEDPDRNGIVSGPLGDAFNAAPFDGTILETVLGDEVPCAIDLLLDENTFPVDL